MITTTTVIAVPPNVDNRASRASSNSPRHQVGYFLNIGRQCSDGEGRPLLFFSIPENPVCSLWDGEGRPSRK